MSLMQPNASCHWPAAKPMLIGSAERRVVRLGECAVQNPGLQLEQKLRQHMRPKCHPILLDSSLHSAVTVRLNLFQAFLLAAMKFHCHHSSLSQVASIFFSRPCPIPPTGAAF